MKNVRVEQTAEETLKELLEAIALLVATYEGRIILPAPTLNPEQLRTLREVLAPAKITVRHAVEAGRRGRNRAWLPMRETLVFECEEDPPEEVIRRG